MLKTFVLVSTLVSSMASHADVTSSFRSLLGFGAPAAPEAAIQPCTQGYRCVTIAGRQTFLTSSTTKTETYEILGIKEDRARPHALIKAWVLDTQVLVYLAYDVSTQRVTIEAYDPAAVPTPALVDAAALAPIMRNDGFVAYLTASTTDDATKAALNLWRDKMRGESKVYARLMIDAHLLAQTDLYTSALEARVKLLGAYLECLDANKSGCTLHPTEHVARAIERLRLTLEKDFAKNGLF